MENLDTFLDRLKRKVPMAEAEEFRRAVWRQIRHRQALGQAQPRPQKGLVLLASAREALVATAASLAAAALAAWFVSILANAAGSQRTLAASEALGLGVFSAEADALAHNRLLLHP